MAVVLEGGCRVSEMREGEPLVEGTLCIWNRIPALPARRQFLCA